MILFFYKSMPHTSEVYGAVSQNIIIITLIVAVQMQFGVKLEPHHVMRKRSIDQPLRIHLIYDDSLHALPHDKQQLVKVCSVFLMYIFSPASFSL